MAQQLHCANLQSTSLRGKNLAQTNFSDADIRGKDFSNVIFTGANFRNSKAGLPNSWVISLVILSLILSLLAGLISGYAAALIDNLFSVEFAWFGNLSLIITVIFLTVIFLQGFGVTLATLIELVAACLIAAIAFLGDNLAISAQFTALALAGVIASVGNMAVSVALVKVIASPVAPVSTGLIACVGLLLGILLGGRSKGTVYLIAGLLAALAILLGAYVGWQAIGGNKKYELIRSLTIGIVAQGGTKFCGADLTDADFTEASLKSVDFRQANLTRTCWFQAKHLEQAHVEGTYLELGKIRQLVITKDGRDNNYNHLNLRYLNLKDANLQGASFISTDLSEAALQNANLFSAKIAQTQLYQANLTKACLTGAYIENWGISTNTQLDGVKCDYVYMRLPTSDDPDPWRKPDNRQEIFQEGDFTDFIAPVIKTLDLYQSQNVDPREVGRKFKTLDLFHHEGIDPTAAAIAITQLVESNPEAELKLVALKGRGQEKIRLQAIVADDANPSKLNNEYFRRYSEIKSLSYSDLQALKVGIAEKDERISSLEKLLAYAVQQPKFYTQTYQSQGDFIMSQSKGNVNISGAQGDITGVNAVGENSSMTGVALGAISGNVTNTINQLPDYPDTDKPGIKELLNELQTVIEADANLSDEDKEEALKQVQAIAEAGQKPEDGTMQKMVKNALKFLKGTIADLPSTVELVQTCGKLLPLVSKFFGL